MRIFRIIGIILSATILNILVSVTCLILWFCTLFIMGLLESSGSGYPFVKFSDVKQWYIKTFLKIVVTPLVKLWESSE